MNQSNEWKMRYIFKKSHRWHAICMQKKQKQNKTETNTKTQTKKCLSIELRKKNHGVWTIGWQLYSVTKQRSALAKMFELSFWCCWNETYKDKCLKESRKFLKSFIIWGYMSVKRTGNMAIPMSTSNAHAHIQITDKFLTASTQNNLVMTKINFWENNASSHWVKWVKAFLQEIHIKSMTCAAEYTDLNSIENQRRKN